MSTRLSADDWIDAALQVLQTEGATAVAVQPLARTLGATKGSFYWHFATRGDLMRAVLERWLTVGTDEIIAAVDATPDDPTTKARSFVRRLVEHDAAGPGQYSLARATGDPDVLGALETATARRIAFLAKLLRAAGVARGPAGRRAVNVYAACIGHAQFAHAAPSALPASARGRRDLLDDVLDAALEEQRP